MMNNSQIPMFDLATPEMNKFDMARCKAKHINYQTAANMVETYHYAHRVPPIIYAIGLYVDDVLAGCITYGVPASSKTRSAICGTKYQKIVFELNRLYLYDWVGRNIEIFGKERTSKSFYNELGSQAKVTILKRYPDAIFHEYTRKHRYVYFLGNKTQIKEMKKCLRWKIYPYPKS